MKLFLDGHTLGYEMQALCFAFFPGETVTCETITSEQIVCETGTQLAAEHVAATHITAENNASPSTVSGNFVFTRIRKHSPQNGHSPTKISALVCICLGGVFAREGERVYICSEKIGHEFDRECESALGRALYRAASRLCGVQPPWGILTGIRPVKLVRSRIASGMTVDEVCKDLKKQYYTSYEKSQLCLEAAHEEERIVSLSCPDSVSLYISIPFCPSRCLYCSFISHDVAKTAKLLPDYVRLLCEELKYTGALVKGLSLRIETIYIGGGTPTVLSAPQLAAIMSTVKNSFNLTFLREYTVEAGRPDTITREKLDAIMEGGARRISINPQTLDDAILKRVGRNHTAAQVYDAFALAKQAGVPSINMDLIAGLPGDTPEGFERTLDGVLKLDPESVTVHTLAMKRSSRLVTECGGMYDAAGVDVAAMLRSAGQRLADAGQRPYYLYRQKNTLGGLENVGFAKPGFEGLYNIFIMDETHSILATGAGGTTKLRQPHGDLIERVFNFKYPYEYISRFDEIIDRKKKVKDFYASYRIDNRQS